MRNRDLELPRTFVTVVEQEFFAAAAKAVHRTQSAITQRRQQPTEKEIPCATKPFSAVSTGAASRR